jgi:hypothetical protein
VESELFSFSSEFWPTQIVVIFRSAIDCSRYKPPVPIITISRYEEVARQLHLYRGVFPLHYPKMERDQDWSTDMEIRINYGIGVGKQRGFIHSGDIIVIKLQINFVLMLIIGIKYIQSYRMIPYLCQEELIFKY